MKYLNIVFVLSLLLSKISDLTAQGVNSQFSITSSKINGPETYQRLAKDALQVLNKVINSDDFKNEVLKKHFDWQNLFSYQTYPVPISNEEVLKTLYSESHDITITFKTGKMYNWRLRKMYGTLGKTNLNSLETNSLIWWLNPVGDYKRSVRNYASHIAHEYCHMRGFSDKATNPPNFPDVVPYAIGNIVQRLLETGNFD